MKAAQLAEEKARLHGNFFQQEKKYPVHHNRPAIQRPNWSYKNAVVGSHLVGEARISEAETYGTVKEAIVSFSQETDPDTFDGVIFWDENSEPVLVNEGKDTHFYDDPFLYKKMSSEIKKNISDGMVKRHIGRRVIDRY